MKKVIIILAVYLLLVSCSASKSPESESGTDFGDGGLFSATPCGPPCFYGITPGITTREEVSNILYAEDSVFEGCEAFDNRAYSGLEGIACNFHVFSLVFEDDLVDNVAFTPGFAITLEQVIEEYGEPSRLYTFSTSFQEYPIYGEVKLCFNNIKMMAWLPPQEGDTYHVSADSTIESISY
ncbi:MAG: hypothetical protein WA110_01445, partial [Anaerolineaceae bacterium]